MRSQVITKEGDERTAAVQPRGFLDVFLRLRAFQALRYRDYRLIWYGQTFVSLGTWMDEVTRGWLIYELTNSALQLGLVRGIQAIPFLLLSPVAGSVADRYSRKIQLIMAQVVNGLVFAVTALLIFTGLIRPWHVYVTAFLMAIVQTFQQPARAAMVSDSVPKDFLINAIGLNSTMFNMARSTGPAIAGVLIAIAGTGGSYSVQALFYFLATFWTVQLRPLPRSANSADGHVVYAESFGRSIVEGWKFSWRNEAVRTGLIAVTIASLFIVPFTTLLPVFARDLLQIGAAGQGLLLMAMGIGALLSSFLIASSGDKLPRGMLMLGSVAAYGFTLAFFAASVWYHVSLALMVIAGLCHVHSHSLVQTVIQSYSPPEFRGRTMSLFYMSRVVTTLGSTFVGILSSVVGARWAVASMCLVGASSMIMIYAAMPRARLIR